MAGKTVGELSVLLTINGEQFTAQLSKAQGDVARFKRQADQGAGGLGGLAGMAGSAAIGGAAGALASFGESELRAFTTQIEAAADAVAQLARESDRLGVSTENLTALHLAAGPAAENMGHVLDRLNRELGAAREGSDAARDKFNALGLDWRALAEAPLDEAVGAIADKFQSLPTAADRARLGVQLFGRGWAELAPLLGKGSAGIEDARQRAEALGVTFSRDAAAKVLDAKAAMHEVELASNAAAQTMAIILAPAVKGIADSLADAIIQSGGVKGGLTSMVEEVEPQLIGLVVVVEQLAHSLRGASAAVGLFGDRSSFLKGAFRGAWAFLRREGEAPPEDSFAARLKKELEEGLKAARSATRGVGPAPGEDLTARVDVLTRKLNVQASAFGLTARQAEIYKLQLEGATDAQLSDARAIDAHMTMLEDLTGNAVAGANAFEQFTNRAANLSSALNQNAISGKEFANVYGKLLEDLKKADAAKAAKLWEDALTPVQKFNAELADLGRLATQGKIGVEVEAAGALRAFEALEGTLGSPEVRAPGALTAGSKEALSVIAANARRRDEDPQKRVERVLEQSRNLQEKHLENLKGIYDELRRRGMVKGAAINF